MLEQYLKYSLQLRGVLEGEVYGYRRHKTAVFIWGRIEALSQGGTTDSCTALTRNLRSVEDKYVDRT